MGNKLYVALELLSIFRSVESGEENFVFCDLKQYKGA